MNKDHFQCNPRSLGYHITEIPKISYSIINITSKHRNEVKIVSKPIATDRKVSRYKQTEEIQNGNLGESIFFFPPYIVIIEI